MGKEHEPYNCIKTVPIFKQLTDEELDEIIMIATHQTLDKGHFIYAAGDHLNSLYVIHKGKIKITRYSADGKEQVIRILSHGDFLGELALFNEAIASTNAEALEPSVICLVDSSRLKKLMNTSPTLSFKMMDELARRLEKAEALIEQNNLYSARVKIARLLLDLDKQGLVHFHTTKVNFASNLGITPETFSRKLKELENEDMIKIIDNKTIRIKDKLGLEFLINPDRY